MLIGLDEQPEDIVEALGLLRSDVHYHVCLRTFLDHPTLVVSARAVTAAELEELEELYVATAPA